MFDLGDDVSEVVRKSLLLWKPMWDSLIWQADLEEWWAVCNFIYYPLIRMTRWMENE